jgi:hypothetical protein
MKTIHYKSLRPKTNKLIAKTAKLSLKITMLQNAVRHYKQAEGQGYYEYCAETANLTTNINEMRDRLEKNCKKLAKHFDVICVKKVTSEKLECITDHWDNAYLTYPDAIAIEFLNKTLKD